MTDDIFKILDDDNYEPKYHDYRVPFCWDMKSYNTIVTELCNEYKYALINGMRLRCVLTMQNIRRGVTFDDADRFDVAVFEVIRIAHEVVLRDDSREKILKNR